MQNSKKMARIFLSSVIIMAVISFDLPETMAMGEDNEAITVGQTFSAGFSSNAVIKTDGSLWMWGINEYGVLGDGTFEHKTAPILIMDDVKSVSIGSATAMAIKTDNSLWTWGINGAGQMGDIPNLMNNAPLKILDDVKSVSEGCNYTMIIKNDDSLWAMGSNGYAQLGNGSLDDTSTLTKIMDDVKSVFAGVNHTLAIKNDGSLWAWGYNDLGQIGDGTIDLSVFDNDTVHIQTTPVKIMEGVVSASAGSYHSMAIKDDGSLWAWGYNGYGQLGDGTNISNASPVKILDGVKSVYAAYTSYTLAIKSDGSLWRWGADDFSGWYNEEKIIETLPVKIMDHVAAVSGAQEGYHLLALKTDGSLWTWGYEQYYDEPNVNATPTKRIDGVMLPAEAFNTEPSSVESETETTPESEPPEKTEELTLLININVKIVIRDIHNIGGSSYFKLRDIAYLLNGTKMQFDIDWDADKNAIIITTGTPYKEKGGELAEKPANVNSAIPVSSKIFIDGVEIKLDAFNIAGSNYFKLRDLGKALNLSIGWDEQNNTIAIDILGADQI